MSARAIIIGAPRSGSGKTSVTIGLLRALSRRGLKVRGVKSGPDYIDPGFHAVATGLPGLNLDSWAMNPALLDAMLADAASSADILVIESAMGLFDGIPSETGRSGSAAEIARRHGVPVLLVLDVSGQSQTAAAVAKGFATYDPAVRMAGVVLNKLGSERHQRLAGEAIEAIGLPVLGAVLRDAGLTLPERHLGLVQAHELGDANSHIDRLADVMERSLDIERILSAASALQSPSPLPSPREKRGEGFGDDLATRQHANDLAPTLKPPSPRLSRAEGKDEGQIDPPLAMPPPGQRIALAQDAAFSFLYPHLAEQWRAAGAELVPFSPLADEAPDLTCDICWLPGGYPELHAGRIAAAGRFKAGMAAFAAQKLVHGECGGFMVLGQALEDADGATHAMLGLLGHATSFAQRKMNLGYRRVTLLADTLLGRAGTALRGHEFHYARVIEPGNDDAFAQIADGQGKDLGLSGGRRGKVSGAFFHAIATEP